MKFQLLLLLCIPIFLFGQRKHSVAEWQSDLRYLEHKLAQRHANLFHSLSAQEWHQGIADLIEKLDSIPEPELIVRLSELIVRVKDAHTYLHIGYQEHWDFKMLPIELDYFADGIFIVAAGRSLQELIGSQLLAINEVPLSAIIPKVKQIGYNENEFTQLLSIVRFMVYPEVLKCYGLIEDTESLSLLVRSQGEQHKVSLDAVNRQEIQWVKFTDTRAELPVVYQKTDHIYWSGYLAEKDLLYVQLNQVREDEAHRFPSLSDEIVQQIREHKPHKLVLDLRRNVGGNSQLGYPLLYALMHYERQVPDGQLYIIIGRRTLSAAIVLTVEIQKFCAPVIVGEPTGAAPNLYGENSYPLTLPHSKLSVSYSSAWFQPAGPFVHGRWIAPDLYIPVRAAHFFNLEQPVLNAILSHEKDSISLAERILQLVLADKTEEALDLYEKCYDDPANRYVNNMTEIRRMANQLCRKEKADSCLQFHQLNTERYPGSAHAMLNLAQVREDRYGLEAAKPFYQKAKTLIDTDTQLNAYLKHYFADFINQKLKP